MPFSLQGILTFVKGLLPGFEPMIQAQIDGYIKTLEAQIAADASISPDWKVVEENALKMMQAIVDAEGAKLAGKVAVASADAAAAQP